MTIYFPMRLSELVESGKFTKPFIIDQGTLDDLCSGKREPTMCMLYAICAENGCSADWLIGLSERQNKELL